MGCLYKLTSPSGKSYIGITMHDTEKRLTEHVKRAFSLRARGPLHAAIRKYGLDAFTQEILGRADEWSELCAMEKVAIETHQTLSPLGYNMTSGGDGVTGMSEEARRLHREHTSVGTKAAWADPAMRANRAAAFTSPTFKAKHSKATSEGTRAAFADPEKHQRMADSHRAQSFRDQARASVKRLWADPAYRANQVAKRLARPKRSEESIRAQSEKMKRLIAERKAAGTYRKVS